jgi:HAD superfamily hydrolase (TIGR01509 family)
MRAVIFDLDGTLIDSVYPHTLAWQGAFAKHGLRVAAWRIHRRIGLSGHLLVKAIGEEIKQPIDEKRLEQLSGEHERLLSKIQNKSEPLPGVSLLLHYLRAQKISYGIATTGKREETAGKLKALDLPKGLVVIDGSAVQQAKPEPELFQRCQQALGVERSECLVVGDAIWDVHAARRAGLPCVCVLTGGSGEQELYNAGAIRVYEDAHRLQLELNELGFETHTARRRPRRAST